MENGLVQLSRTVSGDRLAFAAIGSWTASIAAALNRVVDRSIAEIAPGQTVVVDVAAVERLDAYGTWLLERLVRRAKEARHEAGFTGAPGASRDTMQAAPEVLRRLDKILTENADALRSAITNIDTFCSSARCALPVAVTFGLTHARANTDKC